MKYIKRFNESNLTDYIDWDFISSAKDLSLELIDEGWTLSWGVECETTIPMSSETYTVVSGLYNHVENSIKWENWYKEGDDLSNKKLSYQFYLSRSEGLDMSTIRGILNKEFKNKLREMFPNKPFDII